MNAMSYKGYEAVVAYDEDADLFHGEVVNITGRYHVPRQVHR